MLKAPKDVDFEELNSFISWFMSMKIGLQFVEHSTNNGRHKRMLSEAIEVLEEIEKETMKQYVFRFMHKDKEKDQ